MCALHSLSAAAIRATARPSNFSKENYNAVSTLYFNAIHSILTGEEDADVALELLKLDLADLLGG